MANPTTAKPTGYFPLAVTTASTVGENAVADFPLNTECFRETTGNLLLKPFIGLDVAGTGYPPVFNATGFTAGDVSNDPCITFRAGSTPLFAEGRGWSGTMTNPRTVWCVFRVRMGAQPATRTVALFGNAADNRFSGIGFTVGTTGTITLGQMGTSLTSASITLTRDKWYLVALTYTGSTSRIIQVYNYTDQAYVTTQATGNSFTGQTVFDTPAQPGAVLNYQANNGNGASNTFIGDVYACGLVTSTFDPATNGYFAALVAYPCLVSRGTYSGGGALTAGGIVNASKNLTQIQIVSNRPSGGTPGSYQFRLHRDTTAGFTPSTGTRLGSLQSSPVLVDTTAAASTNYWYRVEQYDGTDTVYSTTATTNYAQASGRLPRGEFFAITTGDSRWTQQASDNMFKSLHAMGYRCGYMNMCMGSTSIYSSSSASLSWQPNTTQDPTNGQASTVLLANAVTMATDCGNIGYFTIAAGINDSAVNNSTVYGTRYGYILNFLGGLGYKRILFKPWVTPKTSSSEAQTVTAMTYHPVINGFANGSTIFAAGDTFVGTAMQGSGRESYDNLHLVTGIPEGLGAALDIHNILSPSGGGSSVIGSNIVRGI